MTWGERIHALTAGAVGGSAFAVGLIVAFPFVRRHLVRDVVAVKRYDQASQVETSIRNLRRLNGKEAS